MIATWYAKMSKETWDGLNHKEWALPRFRPDKKDVLVKCAKNLRTNSEKSDLSKTNASKVKIAEKTVIEILTMDQARELGHEWDNIGRDK